MNLSEELRSKINLFLKRNLLSTEHGDVESFSDFTERDIAEIRLLASKSGVLAVAYIRFRLKENIELNYIVEYYSSVISF